MSWKELFASELGARGFSVSESEIPDSFRDAWEALTEIGQWWDRLDSQTKRVLGSVGPDLVDGLYSAGFASLWPHLASLLRQSVAASPLPGAMNQVVAAWERLRDEAHDDEHYNDPDFGDYEQIRDLAVAELSDY